MQNSSLYVAIVALVAAVIALYVAFNPPPPTGDSHEHTNLATADHAHDGLSSAEHTHDPDHTHATDLATADHTHAPSHVHQSAVANADHQHSLPRAVADGDTVGHGNARDIVVKFEGQPLQEDEGYCFLTRAGGDLKGNGDTVSVEPKDGVWTLRMFGGGTSGQATCIVTK